MDHRQKILVLSLIMFAGMLVAILNPAGALSGALPPENGDVQTPVTGNNTQVSSVSVEQQQSPEAVLAEQQLAQKKLEHQKALHALEIQAEKEKIKRQTLVERQRLRQERRLQAKRDAQELAHQQTVWAQEVVERQQQATLEARRYIAITVAASAGILTLAFYVFRRSLAYQNEFAYRRAAREKARQVELQMRRQKLATEKEDEIPIERLERYLAPAKEISPNGRARSYKSYPLAG